jgi:hypothetical protein
LLSIFDDRVKFVMRPALDVLHARIVEQREEIANLRAQLHKRRKPRAAVKEGHVTLKEASYQSGESDETKCPVETIRRWAAEGKLEADFGVDGVWVVHLAGFLKYFHKRRMARANSPRARP